MATIPNPRTWVVGELLTAAKLNTDLRDGMAFLLRPPSCFLTSSGAQSIPTGGSWTPVTFTTERLDSEGMHSTSSNTNRITAVTAGWYHAQGVVAYSFNGTNDRHAAIAVNGGSNQMETSIHTSSSTQTFVPISGYVFLGVGDWVSLEAFQQSGAALNLVSGRSYFEAQWRYKQ